MTKSSEHAISFSNNFERLVPKYLILSDKIYYEMSNFFGNIEVFLWEVLSVFCRMKKYVQCLSIGKDRT